MPAHETSGPPAAAPLEPSRAHRPLRWLAMLSMASVLAAPAVFAQGSTADSLARLLRTPSIHKRAEVVSRLNALPLGELSPSARRGLVALLDAEATGRAPVDPDTLSAGDETYSEYLLDLTDAVLKLKDPASLRGLTHIGIQTSFEVQRFVASFGATSLPVLAEAWRTEERARSSIVTTWAFTLAQTGPRALNARQRQRVLAAIIAATDSFPIAVASAAEAGSLSALMPLLSDVAARRTSEFVRAAAQDAVGVLSPLRNAQTPVALVDQTAEVLRAFCANHGQDEDDDTGERQNDRRTDTRASAPSARTNDEREEEHLGREETCASLRRELRYARGEVVAGRTASAKRLLQHIAQTAARARTSGAFSAPEAALIEGNATYILSRL